MATGEAEHDPHSPRVALPARGRATDHLGAMWAPPPGQVGRDEEPPPGLHVRGGKAQLSLGKVVGPRMPQENQYHKSLAMNMANRY